MVQIFYFDIYSVNGNNMGRLLLAVPFCSNGTERIYKNERDMMVFPIYAIFLSFTPLLSHKRHIREP